MAHFKLQGSNPEIIIDHEMLGLGERPRGLVMRVIRRSGMNNIRPNFMSAIVTADGDNRVLTIVTRENTTVILTFEPVA